MPPAEEKKETLWGKLANPLPLAKWLALDQNNEKVAQGKKQSTVEAIDEGGIRSLWH